MMVRKTEISESERTDREPKGERIQEKSKRTEIENRDKNKR